MVFRKIAANELIFVETYEKYKLMVDAFEDFIHSTNINTVKKRSNKADSYAKYLVRILIISSELFNVDFEKNDYKTMVKYLEQLRSHPDYKQYNSAESRFPNATINHFLLFINDNLYTRNVTMKDKIYSDYPEEELYSEVRSGLVNEGAKVEYYVTKYERKSKLRLEAIDFHGLNGSVCNINFEKTYGELGKGFIEIHHIKPLYSLEGETNVNPKTDLVPLCPNCHRMIHRQRNNIMTVDELRNIILN